MPKTIATWNGQIVAASDECVSVEGNAYFPPASLKPEFFKPNSHMTVCPWKGDASYYDVVVDGKTNLNAAWVYKTPKPAAAAIANHVAFWKGVVVTGAEFARKPD